MKKISKEAKIGLVTLVGLFLLYFGLNYLKGVDIFKPANHYYVKFDNVSDLQKSSPIFVNGFKIGLVNDIFYNYQTNEGLLVEIALDKSMRIETGSYVRVSTSLTAGGSLSLVLNKHVTTYYSPGDTLEGRYPVGMMEKVSENIVPQIEVILPKLDSILTGLQLLVNNPTISQSLNYISQSSYNLSQATGQINKMLVNDFPVIVANFKSVSSDFADVSRDLKNIDFETTMQQVNVVLENLDKMTHQMNSKDNTLGLLLNDKQLYDNLNAASTNASSLLLDLRENPKRYVHFSIW
jgi:phospholipid/cholesterol/gamma-HCH transport system substrate-binding protein